MSAAKLLACLDGVKQTGADRWLARCPAHDDRRASLAIRELDGGRVLAHCYAGCPIETVLGACGLTFDALYPPRAIDHRLGPERRPFPAADVLRAVGFESLVVACAAGALSEDERLSETDRARLVTAAARISSAITESGYA